MTQKLRSAIVEAFLREATESRWEAAKIQRVLINVGQVPDGAPIPDWDEEDDDAVGTQVDYFGLWHLVGR